MKDLTLLFLLILPGLTYSQGAFTNQTHQALQKVISDYPNHFKNIKGDLIGQDPQTSDFRSNVDIPGSVNAVITKYSSESEVEIYSWKCLMMETEDFDDVSRKYNELYNQILNSIIKVDGQKPFILNGNFEAPTESKKFSNSSFYLLPAASGELKRLKVELSLGFYVTEWKLSLMVYDDEARDLVSHNN
jgi:hypothetical protein